MKKKQNNKIKSAAKIKTAPKTKKIEKINKKQVFAPIKKSYSKIIKFICGLVLLIFLTFSYLVFMYSPISQMSEFTVENGASVSYVAKNLSDNNLIFSENIFKASVIAFGGRIQSGVYEVPKNASVWKITKMLAHGDVASTDILLQEGLTIKQIKKLLMANTGLTGETECATKTNSESMVVCNLRDGDLFPDTYRVAIGTSRIAVLGLAKKKMDSVRIGWEKSGQFLPKPLKDWNQVITLASIVQKETPKASEMPMVASVYLNRLRKNMKLQADPTVVYAITNGFGDMDGKALFTGHLKTASPYNTYVNYGLPPAPIANVGRDAIAAVLNPADTTYLFFVADGQGGHKFSRDYAEHKKNHELWRIIKKNNNK